MHHHITEMHLAVFLQSIGPVLVLCIGMSS